MGNGGWLIRIDTGSAAFVIWAALAVIVRTPTSHRISVLTQLAILLGVFLSILLWTRSQVAGDQLNLLSRGWLLVAEGQWIPFGLPTSAGGKAPGSFTSIVVGLPLAIWQHHRAPTLVILTCNLVAYLFLDRMLSRELGPVPRLLFAVFYWLSPWRLYYGSFLWNPNYLMPVGAFHFWTIYRQKDEPRFWESFLQVVAVGLAAQVHASVVTLVILSLLLWWRGYFRFHWPGVGAAVAVVAVSLVPWAQAVLQNPELLPHGTPHNGRIAQTLLSSARGIGYWLRYPALIASSTMLCLDFRGLSPGLAGDPIRQSIQVTVALLTAPATIWANARLWAGAKRWWSRPPQQEGFEDWLVGVVRWSFVGVLLACILTPTAVMSWQLLTVLHLAVMPLVIAGSDLVLQGRKRLVGVGTGVWTLLSLAMIVAIGLGSPMFRCGGQTCGAMNADPPPLRSDHAMLDELQINLTCPYEVDVPGGWWPDVLPER